MVLPLSQPVIKGLMMKLFHTIYHHHEQLVRAVQLGSGGGECIEGDSGHGVESCHSPQLVSSPELPSGDDTDYTAKGGEGKRDLRGGVMDTSRTIRP